MNGKKARRLRLQTYGKGGYKSARQIERKRRQSGKAARLYVRNARGAVVNVGLRTAYRKLKKAA